MFNKHLPLLHGNVSILPEVRFFLPADAGNAAVQRQISHKKCVCCQKAVAHGQQPRPLSQSLTALTALPKGEPMAVHTNFISMPRPLPLRKDFPRAGGRCRAATKGGVWICEAKTERAHAVSAVTKVLDATRDFPAMPRAPPSGELASRSDD